MIGIAQNYLCETWVIVEVGLSLEKVALIPLPISPTTTTPQLKAKCIFILLDPQWK